MLTFYELFEDKKIIKREESKNYNIKDYKNPPEKDIQKDEFNKPMYRKKVVYGKDGQRHVLTFAIKNTPGPRGGKTEITSKWDKK